jgi:hypothetical protein
MIMKNKLFIGLMSVFLVVGIYHLSTSALEVDYTPDAMAATVTMAPSNACTDPTITAFTGSLAYTITWSAPAAATAATPSATAVLSGAVNSDSAGTVTATHATNGATLLSSATPTAKLAGLQCQTGTSSLQSKANGDGTDNTSFSVYIVTQADSATASPIAGDQVDTDPAATPQVLFGTGGSISTSKPTDGAASDANASTDGETSMSGTETTSGTQMKTIVDVTNYNVAAATDTETLTLTFAPE